MKRKNIIILVVLLIAALGMSALSYFGTDPSSKTLSAGNIKKGLDLSGGVYVVYEANKENPSSEEMNAALSLLRKRLDSNGWTDGEVSIENGNRLRVEIPGVENAEEAVAGIGQAGELMFLEAAESEEGQMLDVVVTGGAITNANVQINDQATNPTDRYQVGIEFDSNGTQQFADATQRNIGKPIYILLDGEIISAPNVNTAITDGRAVITGDFTSGGAISQKDGASNLASLIRSGSLPFSLSVLEKESIGATLGEDSLNTSLFAGIIGITLVFLFMLIFYRVCGLAADWALVIYLSAELLVINALDITLTLPGIAGIVLSVGMAVDANVIIFERIKEELAAGRTLRLALENGFSRAFPAIFDSNITTLIACGVLFWLGTGPIKGFAETLALGIVLSMFTALVVTRLILKGLVGVGIKNSKYFGGR